MAKSSRGRKPPRINLSSLPVPATPHAEGDNLAPRLQGSFIFCPVKGEWRVWTPEEQVRQEYILRLHFKYGYSFEQMDQERRTKHGHKSPKADIVVWESAVAKDQGLAPIIVVEVKSDNVTIDPDDYEQGESYARALGSEFLVTHNNKETRPFRLISGAPGRRDDIEDIPGLADLSNAKQMAEIRRATKAFTRDEFKKLLSECHNILRDNHKMDPGRAFDEMSKVLFIKMYLERTDRHERFTVDYLDEYARLRRRRAEDVMHDLFDDTKQFYKSDRLFEGSDALAISYNTFHRIVQKLQRFNLGATSDDVKGIAFESFLGQTFRGDLGQFFTPRPIVDFMVSALDPQVGQVVCDPASGSGGFLIRVFEHVRGIIERDVHEKKRLARARLRRQFSDDVEFAENLDRVLTELNADLDVQNTSSRLFKLAHDGIFGTDAEARAARTSKMNMVMHGDGHGGIHHHDGFVDVNGIFPGRFDAVITNPPFGANVGEDQIVGATSESRVETDDDIISPYRKRFGAAFSGSHARMLAAQTNKTPVLELFDNGRGQKKVKSEILFAERCLQLLNEGGELAVVVPDGFLNNPSIAQVREYIEDCSKICAVISIPDKTFRSAKTAIKASILFLKKYTEAELLARKNARTHAADAFRKKLATELRDIEAIASVSWRDYKLLRSGKKLAAHKYVLSALGVNIMSADDLREQKKLASSKALLLEQQIVREGKAAVKRQFDYDVFLAVAEHVGIRASGKVDPINELPRILDFYKTFKKNKASISKNERDTVFRRAWSTLDRWDPPSYKPIDWTCAPELLDEIGSFLRKVALEVDRDRYDFSELCPITIHFDGSVEPRDTSDVDDYTMDLYFAEPGNIVVSKIDLKNGAVGLIPQSITNAVVTNHFVVYQPDLARIYPPYFMRIIQSTFFKDFLWRKKVGSEGRKEVKMDLFERTKIPLPDIGVQKTLVAKWESLERSSADIQKRMDIERAELDASLISGRPAKTRVG